MREGPTIVAESAFFLPLEDAKLAPVDMEDIAKAVYFLLSEATYVTGETINVDGGRHVAL